jgi:hypothetical protein
MAKSQKTKSYTDQESKASEFNFPFGKCEEMFKMMEKFCSGNESSSNCYEKMQQMCGSIAKEPEKK